MSIDDEHDALRRRARPSTEQPRPLTHDQQMQHVVIKSDYPDEPSLHVLRHEDGDIGIAVAFGERWPGIAATLCASGGRNAAAWEAGVALWRAGSTAGLPKRSKLDLSEYIEDVARVVYRVPEGGLLTRTSYADLMEELRRLVPAPGTKRIVITLGEDNGPEGVELEGVSEAVLVSVLAELLDQHQPPPPAKPMLVLSTRSTSDRIGEALAGMVHTGPAANGTDTDDTMF